MRRILLAWLGVCSLVGYTIPAPAVAADGEKMPLAERAWIATRIYAAVNTYFGHWRGVPDLDFDREFRRYLDKVLATEDRRAFDLSSMALVASLRNGHSGFGDRWLREMFGQPLGFSARPIAGRWMVTKSQIAELKPGDELSKIDGTSFEKFYEGVSTYISASDERWRRRALFENPFLFPASFSLELENGRKVVVRRRGAFRWPGDEATGIETSEAEGVVTVRVPSFAKPLFEEAALEAVRRHASARAFVFDVRGNHGGSTPGKLVEALMDRPYRWYAESTPASLGLFRYQGYLGSHAELSWYGDVEQPVKDAYRGTVFILIDGGCFSACEDFVLPFKDNRRATLVGERTGGSSGQPYSEDFGNGMGIGLSTKREAFPDGSVFEGVGIAPDIEVPVTIEDLRSGSDRALAEVRRRLATASGK